MNTDTQERERPLTLLSRGVVLSDKKTYLKLDLLLLLVPIPGGKPGVYQVVLSLIADSTGDKSSRIGAGTVCFAVNTTWCQEIEVIQCLYIVCD